MDAIQCRRLIAPCLLALFLLAPMVCLAKSAKQKPPRKSYDAYLNQAESAMVAKNYQEAIDGYEGAYQIARDPVLLFNIATAHRRAGRFQEALSSYERFLSAAPKHELRTDAERYLTEMRARVEEDRGRGLFEGKQFEPALSSYQIAFRLRPTPRLEVRIGVVQDQLGQRDAAIASLEHGLSGELDSRDRTEADKMLAKLRGQREEQRARELEGAGQYEQAALKWAASYQQQPTIERLFAQGQAHRRAHQYREAARVYGRLQAEELSAARRAEVEDLAVLCRAMIVAEGAEAKFRRQQYEGAVLTWDEALKVHEVGHFYIMQGRAYRRAGRYQAALSRYELYLQKVARSENEDPQERAEAEAAADELRRHVAAEREAEQARRPPVYKRAWFIALMGGLAAGVGAGVATGLILGLPKTEPLPDDIGGAIPVRFP